MESINPESPVTDTETLYRAVLNDPRFLATDPDGRIAAITLSPTDREN